MSGRFEPRHPIRPPNMDSRRRRRSEHKMTTATIPEKTRPPAEDMKSARRISRKKGLFAPDLLRAAAVKSFAMLRPDILWKNPVMFVVEVGTVLSIVYTIYKLANPASTQATLGYLIALNFWLLLTVLFANFAEALAEARGKAQADSLRKTRRETPAFRYFERTDDPAKLLNA